MTSVSNPVSRYSGEPRSKGPGNRGGNGICHDQAVGKLALIIHPVGVTRRIRVANPTDGRVIDLYLVLGSMLGLYMAPLIIAMVRDHHRWPWIGLLNFAAGGTVVGWIAALAWSVTAIRPSPIHPSPNGSRRSKRPKPKPGSQQNDCRAMKGCGPTYP